MSKNNSTEQASAIKPDSQQQSKLGSQDLHVKPAAKAEQVDEEKIALKTANNDLQRQVEQLQRALEQKNEEHKRALADYHNVLERSEREIGEAQTYGLQSFARELLAILDTFEQAIASVEQEPVNHQAMIEGVSMTFDMMKKILAKFEIEAIDPQGQPFDPDFHEAISAQPAADQVENSVLQVIQKGYKIKDRLLRPALVVVVKHSG